LSTANAKIKNWFSKAIIVVAVLLYVFGIALIYAETYYSSAILVSTNLLSGLTINSVDYFGYNCSIPANTTLKVQFSQDGDSWYSASHVADTWTDLSDGSHLDSGSGAIALSGFDIDTPNPEFYYKIQLSTSDTATTPNFISVNLIYNTGSYATATTQSASGVLAITATGNGNITATGSSTITKRGFQYGISQTVNLREVSETGTFGTGAFSLELTYLYAGTIHYVRSFAQNSEGRAYGDWQEFTALDNYYYSSAVGVSSNLLSGQTVNSINGFFATTSIPSGTGITAQFSQDNSSWYSAGGTLDGTTTLSNGANQIDLTGLGWSGANFYYKVALSADSGRLETPVLQSVYLNYNVPIDSSGPSDNGSSASNPTLSGNDIDFSITATDSESDNYYFAVCKTNSITANNEAVPTCGGGNWCVSSSTVSASQASCSYTTSDTDEGDNAWYAFICDHNADSACSVAMQGTGDNGSPFSVFIDTTAPTTTADAGSYVFGEWSNENVEVSLSCNDGSGSGCATTKYCVDTNNTCVATTDYTTAVEVSTAGTSYIRYLSTDNETNEETTKSSTIKIDKTAPTTTADAGSYVFGEWSNENVEVSLSCNDGSGSGCATTKYCVDTENTCLPTTNYTTAVSISTEGTNYIRYLSTDNATNEETTQSSTIKIDKTAPTTTADAGSYVFGEWSNENVEVSLSCNDGSGSGCATTKYCVDTNNTCVATTDYTTAVEVSTAGTSYIRYLSTDNETNEETTKSSTIKIDKTAPTTTADAGSYVFGEESGSQVSISLSCSDELSGCYSTSYCADLLNTCSPDTAYSSVVPISAGGTTYFRYLSVDNAQNSETVVSQQVIINESSPASSPAGTVSGGFVWTQEQNNDQENDSDKTEDVQEPALEIDKNIFLQMGQQLKGLADKTMEFFFGKKQDAISEITIPQETPEAFENIEIMGELPAENLEISFIGDNIDFFSAKLPDFSQTMQDLGINDLNNLKELGSAEFVLPSIASLVGVRIEDVEDTGSLNMPVVSVADMSQEEKNKIPTDIIFARSATESIEHNMAISISEFGDVEQRISMIANQKVELIIKPQNTAKRITGIVILKDRPEAKLNPFSDLWKYFSAALNGSVAQEENLETYGLLLDKFEYSYEGDGIYKAEFNAPVNEGEYEIITVIEYKDSNLRSKGIKLIAAVDPEGYIFRKLPQGELRVKDALVSIYWLNSETGEYELWPAKKYFQENPQTTDDTGRYVFLVPEGIYYLKAEAKGYYTYESSSFSVVKDIGVHKNIELKKKTEWRDWFDWKIWIIIILSIVVILIAYKYIKKIILKNGTEKNI
jgi:hypothetical protein